MANWKHTLDLTDVWDNTVVDGGKITIQELGKIVAGRLDKLPLYGEFKEIADSIAASFRNVDEDKDEFNNYMNDLYDLGDRYIGHTWPPDKLIWIATNF
jgi:hypothetical protein